MNHLRFLAFCVLALSMIGLPVSRAAAEANTIDEVTLHPAIPLVDEDGGNVFQTGKPYSPRNSCGIGSGGCHDYAAISHGDHFERGRDEADDAFGTRRGWFSHLASPGYFGGFNSQGPGVLAKKHNGGSDTFPADWGAAGMVQQCIECHNGGGWSELDRDGIRYDLKPSTAVASWDGDYFNRGSDENNAPAGNGAVSRWDWHKSGVVENDCLMCHADYSKLRVFAGTLPAEVEPGAWYEQSMPETPAQPFASWWKARNVELVKAGHFRDAATALLEFLDVRPETAGGMNLVTLARKEDGSLELDEAGMPRWIWNQAALDGNQKVVLPMRKFPANDNCWQCHGNRVGQDRRAFWGFGESARPVREAEPGPSGNARPVPADFTYEKDVHKGVTFTDDNGEKRVMDNCNACHTQGIYYRRGLSSANVSLNASHNFAKGNSDIDIRRDLDYQPAVKSCEYCHRDAKHRANPSDPTGAVALDEVHRQRWEKLNYFTGVSKKDSQLGLVNTHLDSVGCQTCHIPADLSRCALPETASSAQRTACDGALKSFDGSPFPIMYRYRAADDVPGNAKSKDEISLKAVPYNAKYQFRYFWRDKVSGRILTEEELNSVYLPKKDGGGNLVALRLVQSSTGKEFELSGGARPLQGANAFYDDGPQFPQSDVYGATLALKEAYEHLLIGKGYVKPNLQMIWTESNHYLVSHNTQPAANALPCQACHDRSKSGVWNGSLKAVFGDEKTVVLNGHSDKRLVDQGVVVLDKAYYKFKKAADPKLPPNEIIASATDVFRASQLDRSMSALRADAATSARGEMALLSLDEALRRLSNDDARNHAALAPFIGSDNAFVLRFKTGDSKLRSMAVAAPDSPLARAVFANSRLELGGNAVDEVPKKAVKKAKLGTVSSDLYRLRAFALQNHDELGAFNASVLVRVRYSGNMCAPSQIRVVQWTGGRPQDTGLTVSALKPKGAEGINYAVFTTDHPLGDFLLADAAVDPKRAMNRANRALAAATRMNAAREKTATRASGRASAAEVEATAAAHDAAELQAKYDEASEAEKAAMTKALNKAKAKSTLKSAKAARLQAEAEDALAASQQAKERLQAATRDAAQAKCES
jgi:hypothetical protein